jgi:DNA-binding transcriptional regulator LsrR (DeoR family)
MDTIRFSEYVVSAAPNLEQLRLLTRVARLYHQHGVRQREIAERLRLSQPRVSRLLRLAEEAGIVQTVVVVNPGIYTDLEDGLAERFGLVDAHVVDTLSDDDDRLHRDLGTAAAAYFEAVLVDEGVIAFGSWSRPLQAAVDAFGTSRSTTASHIVEALGDLGPPVVQHRVANATQRLADLTKAEAVFLRTPGFVTSTDLHDALLTQDLYAENALRMLDEVDLALVGIGPLDVSESLLTTNGSLFTTEQMAELRDLGAVGNVNLRFFDADGKRIDSSIDKLVIGMSLDQLARAKRVVGIAGGRLKHNAIRAALRGGLLDVLITDTESAGWLIANPGDSVVDAAR